MSNLKRLNGETGCLTLTEVTSDIYPLCAQISSALKKVEALGEKCLLVEAHPNAADLWAISAEFPDYIVFQESSDMMMLTA
jgi:hypothetical protein